MKTVNIIEIFSIDLRSAALFRILLGSYLVLDAFNRISLTPFFYSDTGLYPREIVPLEHFQHAFHFQGLFLHGSEWFATLFFALLALSGLLLLAGYKTKAATIAGWLLFCSAIVRDGLTNNSGDILLIQLLFWGMFLPLGKVWSLDSYLTGRKTPINTSHFSAASVGLYVQFVLIYITTGMYKGQYLSWLEGTHLYLTFSRFEFMTPLAFHIYPYYDLLAFLTHFSLFLELFGPLLFFIPFYFLFFRMAGIVLFLGLQVSILLTMKVGFFPIASIAGILVFLPSGFWNTLSQKFHRPKPEPESASIRHPASEKTFFQHSLAMARDLFLILVILYVTLWNMSELPNSFSLPEPLKKPGYFLKLDQRWAMFSSTVHYSEYYSVFAIYDDGSRVDLIKHLKKELSSSEDYHHVVFKNFRWRKFLRERIHSRKYSFLRPHLIDYLVREYGNETDSNKSITQVDFVAHRHLIGPKYDHSDIQEIVLYSKSY